LDTKSLQWEVNKGSEDWLTSILLPDSLLTLLEFFSKSLGGSARAGAAKGNSPAAASSRAKASLDLRDIWLGFLNSSTFFDSSRLAPGEGGGLLAGATVWQSDAAK
jgi:hypothetical protein